jgi:hypothetical protein
VSVCSVCSVCNVWVETDDALCSNTHCTLIASECQRATTLCNKIRRVLQYKGIIGTISHY